jgi:hypothetical protein
MSDRTRYVVGGTVNASRGATYIERTADEQLRAACLGGGLTYVLAPRQTGKSSLVAATYLRLDSEGARVAFVDLSAIGIAVTQEQWFGGLVYDLGEWLAPNTDVWEWWQARDHLSSVERFVLLFEEVLLPQTAGPIVVFFDEIDTTLVLPFKDDFFAALLSLFRRREDEREFGRLSFVLAGVTSAGELLRGAGPVPAGIERHVVPDDFTFEQALPLAAGLGLPDEEARRALSRVLAWTGGHPYLTQRVCAAAAELPGGWRESDVDRLVSEIFFGDRRGEDHNLTSIRHLLTTQAGWADWATPEEALRAYREVLRRQPLPEGELDPGGLARLKLSGVVRAGGGAVRVRNRIYEEVFNEKWVEAHLPPEVSRLRGLLRRPFGG